MPSKKAESHRKGQTQRGGTGFIHELNTTQGTHAGGRCGHNDGCEPRSCLEEGRPGTLAATRPLELEFAQEKERKKEIQTHKKTKNKLSVINVVAVKIWPSRCPARPRRADSRRIIVFLSTRLAFYLLVSIFYGNWP